MKKLKYAVLILIAVAELVYLLFCIDGIRLFWDERASEVFGFTAALAIH